MYFKVLPEGLSAWREEKPNDATTHFSVPKIIYASRTHSQLTQVVNELKRTAYAKKYVWLKKENSLYLCNIPVIFLNQQPCPICILRYGNNNISTNNMISTKHSALSTNYYCRSLVVSVLGSREQMCIHPDVSQQTSNQTMVHMCRNKVSKHLCHFYNNIDGECTLVTLLLNKLKQFMIKDFVHFCLYVAWKA